ncbi:MAG: NagC family transcriptional regulator [Euryarchaeota archaeon]|nr:NagC family transcriptional regulator [Euryarchaeota archaeon]
MIDQRKLQQLMRQVKTEEIKATRVIFETPEGNLVFDKPTITSMSIPGAPKTYQIIGTPRQEKPPAYKPEDIALVREQTGADEAKAKKALEETGGDIAAAILKLQEKG